MRVRELMGKLVPGGKGVLRTAFRCSLIQAIGRINFLFGLQLFFFFVLLSLSAGDPRREGCLRVVIRIRVEERHCSGWNTRILLTAEHARKVTGKFKDVKECQPSAECK